MTFVFNDFTKDIYYLESRSEDGKWIVSDDWELKGVYPLSERIPEPRQVDRRQRYVGSFPERILL